MPSHVTTAKTANAYIWWIRRAAVRLTLKAGDTYHFSGETIPHDELIGKPDGSIVTLSKGKRFLALRPTFGESMSSRCPVGAGAVSQRSLADSDVGGCLSGARVFEAGTGSGAHHGPAARLVRRDWS